MKLSWHYALRVRSLVEGQLVLRHFILKTVNHVGPEKFTKSLAQIIDQNEQVDSYLQYSEAD